MAFHETSNLCSGTVGKGAREPRSRAALQGRFRDAPMPDPSGERPRQVSPPKIAASLGCASQTARNAIRAFNERGLDALTPGSSRPKRVYAAFDEESAEALREMLHRSPREFGHESSLWTLEMAADAAFEEGFTRKAGLGGDHPGHFLAPSGDTVDAGQAVDHLPRPPVRKKKRRRDRLMEIADGESRVGHRLRGRMLVEPGGLAHFEQLGRGRGAHCA